MSVDIATIIAKNYLAQARSLVASFRKYHPDGRAFVLLADRADGYFDPEGEQFLLLEMEDLKEHIPNVEEFAFQYTLMELSTAVKPYLLQYLLRHNKSEKLVYFDPDIIIYRRLDKIEDLLDDYSILLTPHLTSPISDSMRPSEVDILQAGVYNCGFVALRNDVNSDQLLSWWKQRLWKHCIVDFPNGLFVDQKWIDLAPGLFDGVYILRDPGYNVAYWNFHERRVDYSKRGFFCNGEPLYFFHFSGFNPNTPNIVSKHQDRFQMVDIGPTGKLYEEYTGTLMKNNYGEVKTWPYAFASFDNGIKIPDLVRRMYLRLGEQVKRWGNPFSTTGENNFFCWLTSFEGPHLPPIATKMYNLCPDLRSTFPDITGRDKYAFLLWVLGDGRIKFRVDPGLLASIESFVKPYCKGAVDRTLTSANRHERMRKIYHRLQRYKVLRPLLERLKPNIKARIESIPRVSFQPLLTGKGSAPESICQTADTDVLTGVNVAGYINSEKGLGRGVRSVIHCLDFISMPYVVNNFSDSGSENNIKVLSNFSSDNPYPINLIHVNADQTPFFVREKGDAYLAGCYNIGYWNWELSEFPPEWYSSFRYLDEVWVSSSFTLDSVSRVSPVPVARMPYYVQLDEEKYVPRMDRDYFRLSSHDFVFLFAFDFHSFVARKNPIGVIEAFKKAFSPSDNALLVLKGSHAGDCAADLAEIGEAMEEFKIKLIDSVMSDDEIKSLFASADCYVSLHRSEGFGLTMAEAMALGKPVIATGYSGNMDFMNMSNSYLVKYKLTEINEGHGPYKKGYVWADPDIDDAARLMRYVYDNPEKAAQVGKVAAEHIRTYFSAPVVSNLLKSRLDLIAHGICRNEEGIVNKFMSTKLSGFIADRDPVGLDREPRIDPSEPWKP